MEDILKLESISILLMYTGLMSCLWMSIVNIAFLTNEKNPYSILEEIISFIIFVIGLILYNIN